MSTKKRDKLSLGGSMENVSTQALLEDLEGEGVPESSRKTKRSLKTKSKRMPGVPVYLTPKVRDSLDIYLFHNRKNAEKETINGIMIEGLDLWFQKNHKCTLEDIENGTKVFNL